MFLLYYIKSKIFQENVHFEFRTEVPKLQELPQRPLARQGR
jgi:hypothetical protein